MYPSSCMFCLSWSAHKRARMLNHKERTAKASKKVIDDGQGCRFVDVFVVCRLSEDLICICSSIL